MNSIERHIQIAKHRLWFNRWLYQLSWTATWAAGLFGLTILIQRLFDLPLPMGWVAIGYWAISIVAAVGWTVATRESDAVAAAKLDEAAGLRERISSGRYCLGVDDPFAQAVVADAARAGTEITISRFIRLTAPRPLAFSMLSMLLAAMMFLVPRGLLKSADATPSNDPTKELESTKLAVKKQIEDVRNLVESKPALAELAGELAKLDQQPVANLQRPSDIRHEAVKKIEALADTVKQKRQDEDFESMPALQRKLRGLRTPESSDATTQKLTKALREGDFKTAKEEIAAIKEQLATLKSEKDQEAAKKLSEQIDQLSKQLEQVASQEQLAKQLEQAGLKKEDVERVLENLKKNDLEQVQKQLEEKGLNAQQAQNLIKQAQQQQNAGAKCQKLAQAMKQGAQAAAQGQSGEAMSGMSQAEAQLSELEQMQQEMAELDSTLQSLQAAKDGVDNPCSQCGGKGKQGGQPCSGCQDSGGSQSGQGGMGQKMGRGQGGLAQQEESNVDFKVERAKVHTGKGAIIGQFQMDGEQLPGESTAQLVEVVAAAERDASERIQRDRIPRQYQKAVKTYFSNARKKLNDPKTGQAGQSASQTTPAEPSPAAPADVKARPGGDD